MSFSLSGLFSNNQAQSGTVSASQTMKSTGGTLSVQASEGIRFKASGQLSGEVVAVNGRDVTIQVGKDQTIQAKLGADINVSVGQNLTFEVQKGSNGQITLRALYTNTDVNPTAQKALEMANLPVKGNTVSMVETMMEQGMRIDSNSLQKMYHEIAKNPEAPAETVVKLSKLNLPIKPENVAQFTSYENLKHQLTEAVSEMTKEMLSLTTSLGGEGKQMEAFGLQSSILDVFAGSDVSWVGELPGLEEPGTQGALVGEGVAGEGVAGEGDANIQQAENQLMGEQILKENTVLVNEELEGLTAGLKSEELKGLDQVTVSAQALADSQGNIFTEQITDFLNQTELQELLKFGKQVGFSPELLQGIEQGNVSNKQFLSFLNQMLGRMGEADSVQQKNLMGFLESNTFQKMLSAQIGENWMLKPQEVAEDGKITKLYEKIQEQTARLSQVLNQSGRGDTPFAQTVTNVQQNVEFMNQLNQTVNYVQIPLQMNGKNTQGELYVYTNKKHLAQKDGNLSAFLHLDMDHLGTVDVYVALQNGSHVNTKFYLQDEEMIDFVAEHIDILDERLKSRGYDLNASVTQKEKEKTFQVLDEVSRTEKENGRISKMIASYAFDARA